jgi:hypothetical protein
VARLRDHGFLRVGVAIDLCLMLAAGGCERGARTPDEAWQRLGDAVAARDGARLFDALDLETRWSWMSVQRAHRESYDIVLSNFPEGAEREHNLRRFEDGAHSENARELFARQIEPRVWSELAAALAAAGPAPRWRGDGGQVEVEAGGRPLPFRHGTDGHWGWGYAGLATEAEQIKRRAMADLDQVRSSAADYERAAARQNR